MLRDPEAEAVHFLNPTAAVIWTCCDGRTTIAECVGRLRSSFAVAPEIDLLGDIGETLADLSSKGLLATPWP